MIQKIQGGRTKMLPVDRISLPNFTDLYLVLFFRIYEKRSYKWICPSLRPSGVSKKRWIAIYSIDCRAFLTIEKRNLSQSLNSVCKISRICKWQGGRVQGGFRTGLGRVQRGFRAGLRTCYPSLCLRSPINLNNKSANKATSPSRVR